MVVNKQQRRNYNGASVMLRKSAVEILLINVDVDQKKNNVQSM
jgi:hypothetical protein